MNLYDITLNYVQNGFSVIPLRGGDDAALGKQPALASWKVYQTRRPTAEELRFWFVEEGYTAYGLLGGLISQAVFLDEDMLGMVAALGQQVPPTLLETRQIRSGFRGGLHLYWRTPFDVKGRKLVGGELRGAGQYVVGEGSCIAGKVWEVAADRPIRSISPAELAAVLKCLEIPQLDGVSYYIPPSVTYQMEQRRLVAAGQARELDARAQRAKTQMAALRAIESAPLERPKVEGRPPELTPGAAAAMYRKGVQGTGYRNMTLFNVACLLRDAGYSRDWVAAALIEVHVNEPPRMGQPQENPARRRKEAERTIESAYTRAPRPSRWQESSEEPVSRLDNSAREAILQRPDGTAILRVLEGAILKGIQPGVTCFTEKELVILLKGVVGRHSILLALKAYNEAEIPLFEMVKNTSVRSCPPDKTHWLSAFQEGVVSALAGVGGLGEGSAEAEKPSHRPARLYRFPSPAEICAWSGVKPSGGDPIQLADVMDEHVYRQALEREFIKRRPNQYSQALLSHRLGVSTRTLRRYHKVIPIRSRHCYTIIPLDWENMDSVPLACDWEDFGLKGGCFLQDDTGKRWPAKREIAQKLLSKGYGVEYYRQEVNLYWYGEREPILPAAMMGYQMRKVAGKSVRPSLEQQVREITEAIGRQPKIALPLPPTQHLTPMAAPIAEAIYVKPYIRPNPPSPPLASPIVPPTRSQRYYRQPLEDTQGEYVAQKVAATIPKLSLVNARRLVDAYGVESVKPTLYRTTKLLERQRLRNPAGYLITAARVKWQVLHHWQAGAYCPEFKAEPQRKARRKQTTDASQAALGSGGSLSSNGEVQDAGQQAPEG